MPPDSCPRTHAEGSLGSQGTFEDQAGPTSPDTRAPRCVCCRGTRGPGGHTVWPPAAPDPSVPPPRPVCRQRRGPGLGTASAHSQTLSPSDSRHTWPLYLHRTQGQPAGHSRAGQPARIAAGAERAGARPLQVPGHRGPRRGWTRQSCRPAEALARKTSGDSDTVFPGLVQGQEVRPSAVRQSCLLLSPLEASRGPGRGRRVPCPPQYLCRRCASRSAAS